MVEECTQDSVWEILRCLPVKSLIRFKSVSKSWCAMFENPRFIHGQLSISRKHGRLLVNKINYSGEIAMKLFPDENLKVPSFQAVNLREIFSHSEAAMSSLVQSNMWSFRMCDGLFCYSDGSSSRVALGNIATREFRHLPELALPQGLKEHRLVIPIALGVHADSSSSNDYKIFFGRRILKEDLICVQYAMYTASTESWSELETSNPSPDLFTSLSDSSFINGVYYWVWFRYSDGAEIMIFTFDVDSKVFREMQGPLTSYQRVANLSVFEHQSRVWLAVSYEVDDQCTNRLVPLLCHDVWVMSGDGHWNKQFKIGPLSGMNRMLRLWKNGHCALLASLSEEVYLYDLCSGEIRALGIKVDGAGKLINVSTYEESLVKLSCREDGHDIDLQHV